MNGFKIEKAKETLSPEQRYLVETFHLELASLYSVVERLTARVIELEGKPARFPQRGISYSVQRSAE